MTQACDCPPPPSPIYVSGRSVSTEDKACQLRHLALIGLAASDTSLGVAHLDSAFGSLFEVMARLAEEVSYDLDLAATTERNARASAI
jgi:hypothetical protein